MSDFTFSRVSILLRTFAKPAGRARKESRPLLTFGVASVPPGKPGCHFMYIPFGNPCASSERAHHLLLGEGTGLFMTRRGRVSCPPPWGRLSGGLLCDWAPKDFFYPSWITFSVWFGRCQLQWNSTNLNATATAWFLWEHSCICTAHCWPQDLSVA